MAIYILFNDERIPLTNIGRDCAFVIDSENIPGISGDTITDFSIDGTDLTIETDGAGSPWTVDLSSLVTLGYLLPVNTDSFNIQVNHLNITPSGPTVLYSLPDASLHPNGTLIGMKSGNNSAIDVTGGGTIDGALTYSISEGESVFFTSDGTNWEIVSNYLPVGAPGTDVFLSGGQVGDGGNNQNLRLELNDTSFVDIDLLPSFTLPVVQIGAYITPPSTIGSAVLPHQINLLNATLGRVYAELDAPDTYGFLDGTVLHFQRIGDYPVLFTGALYYARYDYDKPEFLPHYPMRGSSLELVATEHSGNWVWLVRESNDSLRQEDAFVSTPINSIIGYTNALMVALTPEESNVVVADSRRGQDIAIRIPHIFSQPLATGTQVFLSTDLSPVSGGADVPYLQAEPYDSGYPNIYVGHIVRTIGSELAPDGVNYTDWDNERENYLIRLNDERNYVDGVPRSVRLLDGITTWFRRPATSNSVALTNISDLADDIESNSTDIVTVDYIFWYDSGGNLQVYDHSVPFGDGLMTDATENTFGVRATITSGKAEYRRK